MWKWVRKNPIRVSVEYMVNFLSLSPKKSVLAEKLVENAHIITIQGRLILRMAKIRSERWVTRLQQLVNKIEKSCVEVISS